MQSWRISWYRGMGYLSRRRRDERAVVIDGDARQLTLVGVYRDRRRRLVRLRGRQILQSKNSLVNQSNLFLLLRHRFVQLVSKCFFFFLFFLFFFFRKFCDCLQTLWKESFIYTCITPHFLKCKTSIPCQKWLTQVRTICSWLGLKSPFFHSQWEP